jgi:hypothetical protein
MMRKIYRTLFSLAFLLISFAGHSQGDLENALKGAAQDANYIVTGYTSPFLKAMATGINQGWYNTGKPHKTLGFDLTVTVSPVYIPNSDLLYEIDNSQLKQIRLSQTHAGETVSPTGKGKVPTLFGPDKEPTYAYTYTDPTLPAFGTTFSGPPGIDLKNTIKMQALPVPMANLGIGIYKGTDLRLRYIPTIDLGDNGKINMFGIGVMHDVKQWIPVIKNLPFDLSGFIGYTKLKLETGLDSSHPDQKAIFNVTGTTIQGLISKKFSVLTVYGGLGYNIAKSTLALKGSYDLDEDGNYETKDPINVEGSATGPRMTAGLRLKLAVFTFHGDYTIQKYKTLSVGFGIAVR